MSSAILVTHEIRYLDEIKNLFSIDFDYVFSKANYSRPLRSYHLINSEAKCQFLKKNNRCGKEHSHGYAVECKSGHQVLIGNCCAFNHLGLDDEQLRNGFLELSSSERASIRAHRINERLNERTNTIAHVKNLLKQLREIEHLSFQIRNIYPDTVFQTLIERWRRKSPQIIWEYQITKKDKNSSNKNAAERLWYPHICGTIKGLGIWMDLSAYNFHETLYSLLHRVEGIPTKKRLSKVEQDNIEKTFQELRAINVIERELAAQTILIKDFLDPANLILLVQLVKNQTLRAKNFEAFQKLTSTMLDVRPERFVAEVDQDLIKRYGATGIRIAS